MKARTLRTVNSVHRFLVALRPFDDRFRVYQYLSKRHIQPFSVSEVCIRHADALRRQAISQSAAGLPVWPTYIVVEIDRPTPRISTPRSSRRRRPSSAPVDHTSSSIMRRAAEVSLSDVVCPTRLSKREAFAFLQRLVNFDPPALGAPLVSDEHLDYYMGNSEVRYQRDHIQVGHSTVKLLTMKAAPTATFAHILKDVDRIPGQYIACLYWHRRASGHVRTGLWWLDKYYKVKPGLSAETSRRHVGEMLRDMGRTVASSATAR